MHTMKVKTHKNADGDLLGYSFHCPGCDHLHDVTVKSHGVPGWEFNGDADRPTFSPSILVRSGHHASQHKPGDRCWCSWSEDHPGESAPFECKRCHSFVRDGRIQFLNDCTHKLAGQTVELPEIDPKA